MKNQSHKLLSIFYIFFLINCNPRLYKIDKNEFGEPILNNEVKYEFNYALNDFDSKKIDTTAYYVQNFDNVPHNEREKQNPEILKFHKDGYFRSTSKLAFGKFDNKRYKNSVYYGGKYRINNNSIETEEFLPASQNSTQTYIRRISKGEIIGDTIKLTYKNHLKIFLKSQKI